VTSNKSQEIAKHRRMIDAMLGELELMCEQRVSYLLDVIDDKYRLWFAGSTWQVEATGTDLEEVIACVFRQAIESCLRQKGNDDDIPF
jgi:hypothetical protein